jgi:hypothetical protein
MARGGDRASFEVALFFERSLSSRKSNGPRATRPVFATGAPTPCGSDDAENAFVKGNRALTICVFKSLDYVNSPQSKQNVS